MTRGSRFAVGLALALATSSAGADSILERRYTSAKLDGLWRGTLGATPPEASWFALLAPGPTAAPPVTNVPAPTPFGLPFPGTVIGESTAANGATVTKAFPVIPLSRADAAVLGRRLAWSEIYLNRYRYFEAVSTDDAGILAALTQRQYAAALEAYLIHARLYFAQPDLPGKCARLTRMRELEAGPLTGLLASSLPIAWQPLAAVQTATVGRLGSASLTALVCAVQPVRGRAETARLVETRVRERIVQQVRRSVQETLDLLEAASTEFQRLVNDMDVRIASAEIFELERVLGNASANMLLVKEDQLKAARTIGELQAVDLSSLNQPGQLGEFEQGRTRLAAMVALIDGVMAAMADLAGVVADPGISAELAPCAALRGAYSSLDLTRDSATLARAIGDPYESCIARARVVVARFQEPNLDQALMAALARHVRQISETFLQTVNP